MHLNSVRGDILVVIQQVLVVGSELGLSLAQLELALVLAQLDLVLGVHTPWSLTTMCPAHPF